MRNLLLTGFMGTGKTTVASAIGRRFGLRFVDMDAEVERQAGRSIPAIFASEGEAAFRRLEASVLQDLLRGEDQVIATGGGALVSSQNVGLLAPDDVVVTLTCQPEELSQRIAHPGIRPLVDGRDWSQLMELLERRRSAYERFECVDTTVRSPEDVVQEIGRRLKLRRAGSLDFESSRHSAVLFDEGLLRTLGETLRDHGFEGDVVVVCDEVVASLGYAQDAATSLESAGFRTYPAILPSGERHKTLDTVCDLYNLCLGANLDRQATILGLGGGVVGDVAGMLAATYLRGLHLALAPTTLLAQVDASVGGKVGVDLEGVKNLVGAFYPADLVFVDPCTLRTLPEARLSDGLAEVVKIALVRSIDLLCWTEELSGPHDVLRFPEIVRRAAQEKLRVVARDLYERGTERAILNFGHTVGHAIEAASDYRLSHGQAVSIGMAAETWLAERLDLCAGGVLDRLGALLHRFGLPTSTSGLDADRVWELLRQDKKRVAGQIRLALPTQPGAGDLYAVPESDVRIAVRRALGDA